MHWSTDVSMLFDPIRELARLSADDAVRSVMVEGTPKLETAEYDNWNGGTTYYSLLVRVPAPVYAAVESQLERVEGEILKKVERYTRGETHDFVRDVLIQPIANQTSRLVPATECKFWTNNYFRLFVSHLSENKKSAHLLKTHLQPYGISAFVAHDDIEPTKEWQDELEKALFSMDAMAAILAPGFGKSKWCDHEVGVALGRGKVVLPILYGIDPYGLLGKYQGFHGKGRSVHAVCKAVFEALLGNRQTRQQLVSCLVDQVVAAESTEAATAKLDLLDRVGDIPADHLSKIREKAVAFADDVNFLEAANLFFKKHGAEMIRPKTETRIDEEIPF